VQKSGVGKFFLYLFILFNVDVRYAHTVWKILFIIIYGFTCIKNQTFLFFVSNRLRTVLNRSFRSCDYISRLMIGSWSAIENSMFSMQCKCQRLKGSECIHENVNERHHIARHRFNYRISSRTV